MNARTPATADPFADIDNAIAGIQPVIDNATSRRDEILAEMGLNGHRISTLDSMKARVEARNNDLATELAGLPIGPTVVANTVPTAPAPATPVTPTAPQGAPADPTQPSNPDPAPAPAGNGTGGSPDPANTNPTTPPTPAPAGAEEPKGFKKLWVWFAEHAGAFIGGCIALIGIVIIWVIVTWLGTFASAVVPVVSIIAVIGSIVLIILGPLVGSKRQHSTKTKADHNDLTGTD